MSHLVAAIVRGEVFKGFDDEQIRAMHTALTKEMRKRRPRVSKARRKARRDDLLEAAEALVDADNVQDHCNGDEVIVKRDTLEALREAVRKAKGET